MPSVKTSAEGQLVIPAKVRKKLGIKPGQKVNLALLGDKAVITPLPSDPIRALRGIAKAKPSMAKALVRERKQQLKRDKKNVLDSFAVLTSIQDERGA